MSVAPGSRENQIFRSFEQVDGILTRPGFRITVSLFIHLAFIVVCLSISYVTVFLAEPPPSSRLLTMLKITGPMTLSDLPAQTAAKKSKPQRFEIPNKVSHTTGLQSEPVEEESRKADGSTGSNLEMGFFPKDSFGSSVDAAHVAEFIRYYLGILMRRPELDGFENWTGRLVESHCSGKDCDQVLQGIADYFVDSPEFSSRFGSNLSSRDFIMVIYKNVFGRLPSAGETQKWQSDLDALRLTRGQMARVLVNSAEFVNRTKYDVFVILAYAAVAKRMPEENEFRGWRNNLAAGNLKPADVIQSLANLKRQ
ncbi:MAG TPA: DUF4214 domain-containing protein [Acidobacteriota bacterium]|nr:DUF4214 domain-containing protein [Acidobacteriota bacterium]